MARRRKRLNPLVAALQALALLGAVWLLINALAASPDAGAVFGTAVAIVLLPVLAFFGARAAIRSKARSSLFQKVSKAADEQIKPLVRRHAQLVREDAYGKLHFDKWDKEIDQFVKSYVTPRLTSKEKSTLERNKVAVASMIASRVEAAAKEMPVFQEFSASMNPLEFEEFCAEQLRQTGWNARVTTASGDQGVDVIAEKDGVRVVVQCKLYSKPVGNKAVQEIATARVHEQASHGIVVTNNGYTSAAEQLARTNRILLLHYSDLPNLDALLPILQSQPTP